MFSPDIVCSDEFLDMPVSSQSLYFQLGMRADDDGFIQPRSVMRLIGSTQDDLKVLEAKRFILPFESGVVVIKHWLIHNMIRVDRYKPTRFQDERKMLQIKENKAYTELVATNRQPDGNQPAPQVRLGKVRLGKVNNPSEPKDSRVNEIMEIFIKENPSLKWGNKTQRRACQEMLEKWPQPDAVKNMALQVLEAQKERYAPRATTPLKMWEKIAEFRAYFSTRKYNTTKVVKV